MLIQKTDPIGIDKVIDGIQLKLDASTFAGSATWDNYPRAYKNPKPSQKTGYIPECYDENGEYVEVLMNDKVTLTTFFVMDDTRDYESTEMTSGFALIVQCSDLEALFPSISHRADEELIHKFLNVLSNFPGVKIVNIETGITDVYREFDKSNLKLDDMGSLFVFRINMTTHFGLKC